MSRTKFALMASVTSAALVAAAAPVQAEGFYFGVLGGANWLEDTHGTVSTRVSTLDVHFESDTGFLIGSFVGLELDNWLNGLKVELEASYRRNRIGGGWVETDVAPFAAPSSVHDAARLFSGAIDGHSSTFAIMANAWYEFGIGLPRVRPYVGGGLGWASTRVDGVFIEPFASAGSLSAASIEDPFDGFSAQNQGFAYQLGFGINSQVMPGVQLGIGYRFFDGPNTELFFEGKNRLNSTSVNSSDSIKFDNINHSVALTLTVDIDE